MDMLHFMVQIYSELSTSSLQRLEIFAPLAQHYGEVTAESQAMPCQ